MDKGDIPARVLDGRVVFATDQRATTTLPLIGDSVVSIGGQPKSNLRMWGREG